MTNFCDSISPHDLWKREQQLSVLRAFAGRGWQPPAEEDSRSIVVDVELESGEEVVKLMTERPHGSLGVLGPWKEKK